MSDPFIRSIHVQDTARVECLSCGEVATMNTRGPSSYTDDAGKTVAVNGQRPIDHRCPSCGGKVEVLEVNGVPVEPLPYGAKQRA